MILVLRLGLTPLFVLSMAAAQRWWGRAASGVLAGLPLTSASVLLVLAVGEGPGFAAAAAHTAVWGAVVQSVLCWLYARASAVAPRGRRGVASCLAVVGVGFAACVAAAAWALAVWRPPLLLAPVVAALVAAATLRCWPATSPDPAVGPSAAPAVTARPARGLGYRCLAAEALTVTVAVTAPMLGPAVAGLVGTLPVLALTLAVVAHREAGPAGAQRALRVVTAATPAVALFLAVVAAGLTRWPTAAVFGVAAGAAFLEALLLALGTSVSWTSTRWLPTMRA